MKRHKKKTKRGRDLASLFSCSFIRRSFSLEAGRYKTGAPPARRDGRATPEYRFSPSESEKALDKLAVDPISSRHSRNRAGAARLAPSRTIMDAAWKNTHTHTQRRHARRAGGKPHLYKNRRAAEFSRRPEKTDRSTHRLGVVRLIGHGAADKTASASVNARPLFSVKGGEPRARTFASQDP